MEIDINKSIESIIKNSNEVMNINVPMLFQMEEMLLFYGLSDEQLNNFLSSYKQQKIAPISLKALGAANNTIRFQFIIEAIIVCLAGGIIGIIVGLLLGYVGANILGYNASPNISSIVASVLFSIFIGMFFGYYPANKAAKLNTIDALRYE